MGLAYCNQPLSGHIVRSCLSMQKLDYCICRVVGHHSSHGSYWGVAGKVDRLTVEEQ